MHTLWNKHVNGIVWDNNADDKNCKLIIARCAKLLSKLRGTINVWKEKTEDGAVEYSYSAPIIEQPDRINQLFYNLCRGHALVCGRKQINESDLKLIVEIAIDSCPVSRAKIFKQLLENNGTMTTRQAESVLQHSKPIALKEMETLKLLGVCNIKKESYGTAGEPQKELCLIKDFHWFLSDECSSIRKISLLAKQNTMADLL